MHADQRRDFRVDRAAAERQVVAGVGEHPVEMAIELAEIGGHLDGFLAHHEFLRTAAVFDELGDGAGLQAVAFLIGAEVADAGHGSIVVDDLTNQRSFRQACQTGQIDRRLGVAGAAQHAARHGPQRKHMARPDKGIRMRTRVGQQVNGAGAISGGNAGGDAGGGIHAHGEGGFVAFVVAAGHLRQVEFLGAAGGQRRADQPAPVHRHEVHHFRGA